MLPGSRFASGTTTSSKKIAPVTEARSENLLLDLRRDEALRALLDEEAADAFLGLRPDDEQVGDR